MTPDLPENKTVTTYIKSSATAKSLPSCPTLHNPTDCSPPGSSAQGIFQARVLEWGAIAFSTVSDEVIFIIPGNRI